MTLQHLILPTRQTRNIDLFLDACFWSGIQVIQLAAGPEGQLPEGWTLENSTVHGGPGFCRKAAGALRASVVEPADAFLARLPFEFVNRRILFIQFSEARALTEPKFIKPANDKRFPARVYASGADLSPDPALDQEPVLVSDPVEWEWEFRLFIRDRQIHASSPYYPHDTVPATNKQHEQARMFCEQVVSDPRVPMPRAVVLDVGWIKGIGWSVVEANAAVMSGIYDCDPIAVLEVLEYGLAPLPEHPACARRHAPTS